MPRTVLFDLDGTLTDPGVGIFRCIRHALRAMGLPAPDDEALRGWIGPPLRESFEEWFTEVGQGDPDEAVKLYRERFSAVGLYENRVYDGITELLAALAGAGHRLFVVTSKPDVFARRIVAHFQLECWFEAVYGSGLDGSLADKRALVRHVIATEALEPSRCVMIGDRIHDLDGAHANGVPAMGVLWGFGRRAELAVSHTAELLDSPTALRSRLLESVG